MTERHKLGGLEQQTRGAAEPAQQFRVLAALTEDLGSVPSIHMVAGNHPLSSFRGLSILFWLPWAPGTHTVHIHTFTAKHIHIK